MTNVSKLDETTFNLSDFALFLSVMKNKEAYESTLSIITNDPDLKLKEVHVEQVILNKLGKRAIRLDAWALDSENRQYNMEMQNDTDSDNIQKRSRYYQGLIDSPVLKSGKQTRYRHLPATMIIFITQDDIFGQDSAIYTFTEQCKEFPGMELEDGTTKVFLNMTSKNGTPELVSLLQYMKDSRLNNPNIISKDKRILKLAEIVEEVKQSEEWEGVKMSILSVGIERGKEIGIQQGKEIGIQQGKEIGIRQGKEIGIQEGKEIGIAAGKIEGRIEGGIEAILDFLHDLGTVPDNIAQKLQKESDPARLRLLLKKAAKAESIRDFIDFYEDF